MFACPNREFENSKHLLTKKSVDSIHIDMMDGVCVPLKGITEEDMEILKNLTQLPFIFHLMIQDQEKVLPYIYTLPKNEGNTVIFTIEGFSADYVLTLLKEAKGQNLQVGIAIWPSTPIDKLLPFIDYIDVVLIMTTEAGQPNSVFIPESFNRVAQIRKLIGNAIAILVDGSMNYERLTKMEALGVNECIVGRSFFDEKERSRLATYRN